MDELVLMEKDGVVIPVHPLIVEETKAVGWKVVEPEPVPEPKAKRTKAADTSTLVEPAPEG